MNDLLDALEKVYQGLVKLEKAEPSAEINTEIEQLKGIAIRLDPQLKKAFRRSKHPASVVVNDSIRDLVNQGLLTDPARVNWKQKLMGEADPQMKEMLMGLFGKGKD